MISNTTRITSIAQLAALQGVDITLAATSVGLSPLLIERVDDGRQGFPGSYARNLAIALGVDEPTLLAAARTVLDDSAFPSTMASVAIAPKPPDPLRGEEFPTCLTNVTRDKELTRPIAALTIWTVGQTQNNGSTGLFNRINRNTSVVIQPPIFLPNTKNPLTITKGPSALYTTNTSLMGGSARLTAASFNGAVLFEVVIDEFEQVPYAVEYEPTIGRVWVSIGTRVVYCDANTGAVLGSIDLLYSGNLYRGRGVHAAHGKVYVAAYRVVGFGDASGRLFEINPATFAVTRVTASVDMHFANDVVSDGTNLYVVSRAGPGAGMYRVLMSSFVTSFVTLSGGDALSNPTWVTYLFDHLFVSESNASNEPRFVKVTSAGAIVAERVFDGTGTIGKPDADPWLLWVPNPGEGTVTMIRPIDLQAITAVNVAGSPQAAKVV